MKSIILTIAICIYTTNCLAENPAYNQAKKAGIKKCLPVVKKITDHLIEGGSAGTHSIWSTSNPDTSAFSVSIERNFSDGLIFYNVTIAPTINGKCYVEYQKIITSNKSCLATVQSLENAKYKAELNNEVSVLEQGPFNVYLIPNGSKCTVIKKEFIEDGLNI